MLEIIALFFLTKEIGKIAVEKGLKPVTWKIYTVLAWVLGEIIGGIIGLYMFGINNLVSAALVGIGGAITGYLILKANLTKRPDVMDDDIDQIGAE